MFEKLGKGCFAAFLVGIVALVIAAIFGFWYLDTIRQWFSPGGTPAEVQWNDFSPSKIDNDPYGETVDEVVFLGGEQNWPADITHRFYLQPHGSRLIPYSWFLVLEQADNEMLFSNAENLRRFRFLSQVANPFVADGLPANTSGLPVGFVKDGHNDWVGLNCAACHTNQINYTKKKADGSQHAVGLRIEGAPALIDLDSFLVELAAALGATDANEAKFRRFANATLGVIRAEREEEREILRQKLKAVIKIREEYNARNLSGDLGNPESARERWGFGRIDAFGAILNQVTAEMIHQPANAKPADAPVSIPFLWDTPKHQVVQWNGSAKNESLAGFEFGPLGRNAGEVLGVFGELDADLDGSDIFPGYQSSIRFDRLVASEDMLKSLWSPTWPEEHFEWKLDKVKVDKGRKLYNAKKCIVCHKLIKRDDGNREIGEGLYDVETDELMVSNFSRSKTTGGIEGRSINLFAPNVTLQDSEPADKILAHVVIRAIVRGPLNEGQDFVRDNKMLYSMDQSGEARYKARPLNGIWATAPYLHNGSVANLYELLLPAWDDEGVEGTDYRSREFVVGQREFDPEKVGYKQFSSPEEGGKQGFFVYKTDVLGNDNSGHEFGAVSFQLADYLDSDQVDKLSDEQRTQLNEDVPPLTEQERIDLLEFLRSL